VAEGGALRGPRQAGEGKTACGAAWWLIKELGAEIMRDPDGPTPLVQRVWHAWERELHAEVAIDRAATGVHLPRRVAHMLRQRDTLLRQMAAGEPAPPGGESDGRAPRRTRRRPPEAPPAGPPPPRPP